MNNIIYASVNGDKANLIYYVLDKGYKRLGVNKLIPIKIISGLPIIKEKKYLESMLCYVISNKVKYYFDLPYDDVRHVHLVYKVKPNNIIKRIIWRLFKLPLSKEVQKWQNGNTTK